MIKIIVRLDLCPSLTQEKFSKMIMQGVNTTDDDFGLDQKSKITRALQNEGGVPLLFHCEIS